MTGAANSIATSPSLNSAGGRRSWVVVGDPADNRVAFFLQACREADARAEVLDYRAVLDDSELLDAIPDHAFVRLESPGRAPDLYLRLLEIGGGCPPARIPKGLILQPDAWFRGFQSMLLEIGGRLQGRVTLTAHPDDIVHLFDKPRCQTTLAAAGIAVPRQLGAIRAYDELRQQMRTQEVSRVFVKLRSGSAASGVIALRTAGDRVQAFTTVEQTESGLFNSRRIRELSTERDAAALVNALCAHQVFAEEWIPKAGLRGRTFDVRVVTIAGDPQHAVVRLSKHTMTNLHLLNDRASVDELRGRMTCEAWDSLLDSCRRVARLFPRTLQLGLDVAVLPGMRSHRVLEVNAFGDLLKGVTLGGRNTYDAQLAAVQEGWRGE